MAPKPIVYLIDGSSQMYRAYHAPVRTAEGGLLRNAKGQPTNAVYIFVTMLRKLLNEHKPQYIAASFDLPGRTFRDDLVSDYKANRTPMPDELAQQITMVHAACEALGVPILTSERYEADDVIGTLAIKASAAGFDVAIVTLDKDFFQLVGDGIRVFNPREEGTWYDAAGVKEKLGVTPDQVVDVMALMGDTIDNIKGVPGIGDKGARELIATYGTMESRVRRARSRNSATARAARATRTTRGRAGARDPHRRAGGVRAVERALPRRLARGRVCHLQRARSPGARQGVRADSGHDRQNLPHRQHGRWSPGARRAAAYGGTLRIPRPA
jgi:DNA polymerase-1